MSPQRLFASEALTHLDALHLYAMKLCRDEQRTLDLVQETLLKAYRAFHTYKPGTNCRAWLFQICKNSYVNDYRRKKVEPVATDFQDETNRSWTDINGNNGGGSSQFGDETLLRYDGSLLSDEVTASLESLPADYQTVLILCDIEGLTYEEIAEFMQAPIGTIRSRIHRGRKMLAVRLAGYAQRMGYQAGSHTTN